MGQPGDAYEQEADAMADKVVQTINHPQANHEIPGSQQLVQPKCEACAKDEGLNTKLQMQPEEEPVVQTQAEEEEPVQMQEEQEQVQMQTEEEETVQAQVEDEETLSPKLQAHQGVTTQPDQGLPQTLAQSSGQGFALGESNRHAMEAAFGADFKGVRIHTDARAVQMNQQLGAQAFTHGRDIYFNRGKYNPGTSTGQHLLAHELTHVVQQRQASTRVQRQPADKHDLTSSVLSGNLKLEQCFDGEAIVKAPSEGEHVRKIQRTLIHLGFDVGPTGADAKYQGKTAGAVRDFQIAAGMSPVEWDGIVGKKTIGLLDMSVRNHRVDTDIDVAGEDFTVTNDRQKDKDEACKGKPTDEVCDTASFKTVDEGANQAIKLIDKVMVEQLPPLKKKKTDYPKIFSDIFRNNDNRPLGDKVKEVKAHYQEIKKFLGKLKADRSLIRCATDCDGGCRSGSPAYHTFVRAVNKHILTFCPEFKKHDDRILIVLHEAHHASIPDSSDKAYASTRLFDKLDHKKALLNAASFHVYAAWVDKPGSQPIGPEIKDTNLVGDPAQKSTADLSLAHIDQWFRLIPFDMSTTVQGAQEARELGAYKSNNAQVFMEQVFSKWFGMTSPPKVPSETDVQKLKAIEERIGKMEDAFKSPFIILETPNHSFWERGPGSGIALNHDLLQLDLARMIIALLQELVHATPNISAESEPLYVLTINDMRNLRDLDP